MAAVPIVIDQIRDLFDIAEIDPLISLVIDFCHLPDVASLNASCTRLHISMATPLQRMRKEMVDTCLEKFPQSDYARNKRAERYYQQYTKAFGRNLKDNYNYNSGSGEIILKISALLFNAVKLQDSRMVEMIFAEPLVKSFVPCGHFCRYGDYGQSFFAGNDYDWYDDEQMSGISLLHYATEINALRIIDLIVNSKTEIVNSRNYWGFNAFHVAAWNLNVEVYSCLSFLISLFPSFLPSFLPSLSLSLSHFLKQTNKQTKLHTCIHILIHINTHTHTHAHTHTQTHTYILTYIHTCIHIRLSKCCSNIPRM